MNGEIDDEDAEWDDFMESIEDEMEEDDIEEDEEDLDGNFQDMMETSGLKEGDEVKRYRKAKL